MNEIISFFIGILSIIMVICVFVMFLNIGTIKQQIKFLVKLQSDSLQEQKKKTKIQREILEGLQNINYTLIERNK